MRSVNRFQIRVGFVFGGAAVGIWSDEMTSERTELRGTRYEGETAGSGSA